MKRSGILLTLVFLVVCLAASIDQLTAAELSLITGSVYCDHNQNGKLDNEEKGLENIHVQIFTSYCGGTSLQTVHTNNEGNFSFKDFGPDTYFIRADLACVCGGRMPTTTTCQQVDLLPGQTVNLLPFGYSEYGQ